jgi:hypothetical protein
MLAIDGVLGMHYNRQQRHPTATVATVAVISNWNSAKVL